jgi:hypothetical protein
MNNNTLKSTDRFLVFDAEAIGYVGEAFAVGWVVIANKKEVARGLIHFPRAHAAGSAAGRAWVNQNVPPRFGADAKSVESGSVLRTEFWRLLREELAKGAKVFAEVGMPVEAKFLMDCAATMGSEEVLPYPLYDVTPIMAAAGMDPLKTYDRLPSEEPRHNPETDARQSARLLLIALERLELNAEIAAQVLTPDPPAPDAPVEA